MRYSVHVSGHKESEFDTLEEAKGAALERAHYLTAYSGLPETVWVKDSAGNRRGYATGRVTVSFTDWKAPGG